MMPNRNLKLFLKISCILAVLTAVVLVLSISDVSQALPTLRGRIPSLGEITWNESNQGTLEKGRNQTIKTILIWTPLRTGAGVPEGLGMKPFKHLECSYQNCRMTTDRSEQLTADSVLFHMRQFDMKDIPKERYLHQIYLFYMMESPLVTGNLEGIPRNFFNATQTYRHDSDIFQPYDALVPLNKLRSPTVIEDLTHLANRTKAVAWFVSNCHPPSHREEYAEELGKYYPVHKFGKCEGKRIDSSIMSEYKYYFAAENALCEDYVTEKLFSPLRKSVVPIVYGSAKYAQILPPKAVIDVANYTSPKHLAEYLHKLDSDSSLYLEYLQWKRNYEPVKSGIIFFYCGLCSYMNLKPNKTHMYQDINKWWKKDKCIKYTQYWKTIFSKDL